MTESPKSLGSPGIFRTPPSNSTQSPILSPTNPLSVTVLLEGTKVTKNYYKNVYRSRSSYYESMMKKKKIFELDPFNSNTTISNYDTENGSDMIIGISDYYTVGDGDCFDDHLFTIKVEFDGFSFAVDRSYVEFVDFIRKLRKAYPLSQLINDESIPIPHFQLVEKKIIDHLNIGAKHKRGKSVSSRKSLVARHESIGGTRNSMQSFAMGATSASSFTIPDHVKCSAVISNSVSALNEYLKSLLQQQEILTSEELLLFLDEEVTSMISPEIKQEYLNAHDILLLNAPISTCTVRAGGKSEDFHFSVPAKHMIIWRFSSENFDIGFSVDLDNKPVVPYTRCKSHEKIIYGSLETSVHSICVLKWDNSYAKMRSKQLSWTATVVSVDSYQIASEQAMECRREARRFDQQRMALRRLCVQRAAMLTGFIYGSTLEHNFVQQEVDYVKHLEAEVGRLSRQERTLLSDIERAENTIDDLTSKASIVEQTKELISSSWDFTVAQLEAAQQEIKDMEVQREHSISETRQKSERIDLLHAQLQNVQFSFVASTADNDDVRRICTAALNDTEQEWFQLNQDIRSLRRELSKLEDTHNNANNASEGSQADITTDIMAAGRNSKQRHSYATINSASSDSAVFGSDDSQERMEPKHEGSDDGSILVPIEATAIPSTTTSSTWSSSSPTDNHRLGYNPDTHNLLVSALKSLESAKNILEKKNDALYSMMTILEAASIKYSSPIRRNSVTSARNSPDDKFRLA